MTPTALALWIVARPDQVRRARAEVRSFAGRHGADDVQAVAIAVSEAVTNAVLHAYAPGTYGEIEITARRQADTLEVTVRDRGWSPAARAASPGAGLALPLIAALTLGLTIEHPVGGGTSITMAFGARAGGGGAGRFSRSPERSAADQVAR